ncbi:hypothetical protein E2562_004951, partial [Oryza meyeriana var. granulata]
ARLVFIKIEPSISCCQGDDVPVDQLLTPESAVELHGKGGLAHAGRSNDGHDLEALLVGIRQPLEQVLYWAINAYDEMIMETTRLDLGCLIQPWWYKLGA